MSTWKELVGENLQSKSMELFDAQESLSKKSIVGLYFSAHWCGPCREFTPLLVNLYTNMIQSHPEFQIVYVSSDRTKNDFNEMTNKMPFDSIPYEQDELRTALVDKYHVRFLPSMVFLNAHGQVIEQDGRRMAVSTSNAQSLWDTLSIRLSTDAI